MTLKISTIFIAAVLTAGCAGPEFTAANDMPVGGDSGQEADSALPEVGPEVQPDAQQPDSSPEPQEEAGFDAGPEPQSEAGLDAEIDSSPEPQPEAGPEIQPEAGPEPQPEPQPEAGPQDTGTGPDVQTKFPWHCKISPMGDSGNKCDCVKQNSAGSVAGCSDTCCYHTFTDDSCHCIPIPQWQCEMNIQPNQEKVDSCMLWP